MARSVKKKGRKAMMIQTENPEKELEKNRKKIQKIFYPENKDRAEPKELGDID